jgi:GNAT superfamily N-acetyltransferase
MPDSIVPLNTSIHDRENFACGNAVLDRYFHQQASQDVKKKACTCFVLADEENTAKGYYTLSSSSIPRASIPTTYQKKLSLYPDLPVTLLGRLAVDEKFKGQGLGEILLIDALKKSYDATGTIASLAVIVDPIDENAVRFYTKYGFILIPDSGKMFIPMKTIADLLSIK